MGTSTNQRSPDRPTWRLAQALIGRADVSPANQSAELWRAASLDLETNISNRLSDPILANACVTAGVVTSPLEAIRSYDSLLNETRAAGFIFDLARRALARSVAENQGSQGFARELFAETIAYYASRDLPSYVGKKGRIATTTEVIQLKNQLQQHAREIAGSLALPKISKETWSSYVLRVTDKLRSRKKS